MQPLRRHLQLRQRDMASELNSRQQTVSEWETGKYRPRGPSARLLSLIAEQAGFYSTAGERRAAEGSVAQADEAGPQERGAHSPSRSES